MRRRTFSTQNTNPISNEKKHAEKKDGSDTPKDNKERSVQGTLVLFVSISDLSHKPVEEWTEDEVEKWFLEGRFAEFAPKFKGLSGKSLAGLQKEDFLRRCPEMGDVIYNAVQALLKDQALLKAQSMGNFLFQKQKLIVI